MRKHSVLDSGKSKKRLNLLIAVAFGSGVALLITAGILFISTYCKPKETSEIPALSSTTTPFPTVTPIPTISVSPTESRYDYLVNCIKESAEKNEDVIGWIRIEGTLVDYPVVQTDDIAYYLTHDAEKNVNVNGAIFLDRNCDPISLRGNNILYGHHMKDGSMFAAIVEYSDEDFYKDHPIIEFATSEKTYLWEIFAVFITDPSYDYIQSEFSSNDQYLEFITSMQDKSIYKTDISLSSADDILVLSTCTYEYDDARFVVAARREILS